MRGQRGRFGARAGLGAATIGALIGLAGAAAADEARAASAAAEGPRKPVRAVTVTLEPRARPLELSGQIVARHEAPLAFRVGGRLTERRVDVGARVAPGDVLARLDPGDLEDQARAAAAQLAQAEAEAARAAADLGRYAALRGSAAFVAATFDQRQAAAAAAKARAEQARAQLELARSQQAYADLTALDAGIVTQTSADPGQVVAAGQAVLRIALDGAREARVDVPERRIAGLAPGRAATIEPWGEARRWSAVLRELSPIADPTTRTFAARFTLTDPAAELPLGRSVTVAVAPETTGAAARLPAASVIQAGGAPSVWVIDPATGAVRARPVRLVGWRDGDVLAEGLEAGLSVVAAGAQFLDVGVRVRIVAEPAR